MTTGCGVRLQRYDSGRKDVCKLNIASDDCESDVVARLATVFEKMRRTFPNARGRLVGLHEARQLSTVDLLTIAMQGSELSVNDGGDESQAERT